MNRRPRKRWRPLQPVLAAGWALVRWPFSASARTLRRWQRAIKRYWSQPIRIQADGGKKSRPERLRSAGRACWRMLAGPFALASMACRGLWAFLKQRWKQSQTRHLLQGLPALVLGLVLVVLILVLRGRNEAERIATYPLAAQQAWQAKDFHTAKVCYERLTLVYPDNQDHPFKLALVALALDEKEQAQVLLNKVASPYQQGYPPAHLWRAQALLRNEETTAEVYKLAELHLRRVIQAEPRSVVAHVLLARLLLANGQEKQAEPHLLEVIDTHPQYRLDLARLYHKQDKKEQAQQQAEEAARFFSARVRANLDDHEARFSWAESQYLQGKFGAAVGTLQDGMKVNPTPYRLVLAQLFATGAREETTASQPDVAKQFSLLDQALVYDSHNVDALDHLLGFVKLGGPEADKARTVIRGLLAQGKTPAILHLVLANDAWLQGHAEEACQHLELAYRQDAKMAVVANNLAWIVADQEPVDLPRALGLIESALKQQPANQRFKDTRGHILAKQGRWQEALADLEASLGGVPDPRPTHRTIAAVYERLSMPSMAAQHRVLAEKK